MASKSKANILCIKLDKETKDADKLTKPAYCFFLLFFTGVIRKAFLSSTGMKFSHHKECGFFLKPRLPSLRASLTVPTQPFSFRRLPASTPGEELKE
jgi:hypothetical protein